MGNLILISAISLYCAGLGYIVGEAVATRRYSGWSSAHIDFLRDLARRQDEHVAALMADRVEREDYHRSIMAYLRGRERA